MFPVVLLITQTPLLVKVLPVSIPMNLKAHHVIPIILTRYGFMCVGVVLLNVFISARGINYVQLIPILVLRFYLTITVCLVFNLVISLKKLLPTQQLCNQWCQPTAFQPSPTPILVCPNSKVYCLSTSKVRVYWNNVPGAYSYRVYRDGIYKAQVTTNGYTDTGVSCGVQHLYNVNPFPSGGFERICKQNYKISCPCQTPTPVRKI